MRSKHCKFLKTYASLFAMKFLNQQMNSQARTRYPKAHGAKLHQESLFMLMILQFYKTFKIIFKNCQTILKNGQTIFKIKIKLKDSRPIKSEERPTCNKL